MTRHPATVPAVPNFHDRLLVALVCRREEALGSPADSPSADAAALQQGGDLMQRVLTRAQALPDAPAMRARIRRVLTLGGLAWGVLLVMAALAGAAAASSALDAASVVSLPLVLMLLVGLNGLTLLIWLLGQPLFDGLKSWLAGIWSWLASRGAGEERGEAVHTAVIALLAGPSRGRWLLGSVVHSAWLAYTLAGLLTLSVLLSFRSYELAWETTLLSTEQLGSLARGLSWAPGLLGAPGPDRLALSPPMSAVDRQGWSLWMLVAIAVYGALPRLLALTVCALPAWLGLRPLGRDADRPGYARLRSRLMPDHERVGVVDPAPPPASATSVADVPADAALPAAPVPLLAVEWGGDPALGDAGPWTWLGSVDGAGSRDAMLARLRARPPQPLVILVRAAATPDRGLQRLVQDLAAAATPVWLALGDLTTLADRGDAVRDQRIADWARLARTAGIGGGLLRWDPQGLAALPLPSVAP